MSRADLIDQIQSPGVNTDILIVKKNEKIIYQKYQRGYSESTPHLSWSMAKTITGILIAKASLEYKFSLNDQVSKFIPDFKGTAKIIDVIQMSSNIDFTEQYFGLPVSSDVVKMLYLQGAQSGVSEYVKSLPLRHDFLPGDHFYYSSGDTNLLMELLKKVINDDLKYENYPWTHFFDLLNMKNVTFERDQKNIFIGSSYVYMTAPDYLKIGELLIKNGKYNHQQVIPEFYMALMQSLAPGVKLTVLEGTPSARAYSAQITTNLPISERRLNSEHADLPADSLLMLGHQGQLIAASPKEQLIILRLACDSGKSFKRDLLFDQVKKIIHQSEPEYKTAKDENKFTVAESKPAPSLISTKLILTDLVNLPKLIRNYTAKEFCSCHFITGRSVDECKYDVSLTMPVMPEIDILPDKKIKTKFFIGDTATAEYTNEKFGCRLIN